MAQSGGMGVIHKNLDIARQAEEVRKVKRFESGMVVNPLTIHPEATLAEALALMQQHEISGFPVVEQKSGKLVGILTNRDVRFANDMSETIGNLMTKKNHHRAHRRRHGRSAEALAPAPPGKAAGGR